MPMRVNLIFLTLLKVLEIRHYFQCYLWTSYVFGGTHNVISQGHVFSNTVHLWSSWVITSNSHSPTLLPPTLCPHSVSLGWGSLCSQTPGQFWWGCPLARPWKTLSYVMMITLYWISSLDENEWWSMFSEEGGVGKWRINPVSRWKA